MRADAEGPSKLPAGVGQNGSQSDRENPPGAVPAGSQPNTGWYAVNAVASESTAPLPADDLNNSEMLAADSGLAVEIDSGNHDLRLSQFFRPAMWGLAWIPLLLTGLLSFSFVIRASDSVTLWPYSQPAYVDVYGQSPPVGLIGRHLLPTGMPQMVSAAYGQDSSAVIIHGDMLMGIATLLAGLLIVVMITRRSNDAIYVCGPYAVYSFIAIGMLTLNGPLFDGPAGLFPALLGALIMPLLVGTIAKIVAIAMRNAGVFEIDQEEPVFENLEYALKADNLASAAAASGPAGALSMAPQAGPALGSISADAAPIEYAQVCPFCGNPNIQHEHPKVCNACHHNLGLVFENRNGAHCSDCDGILVRDSVFCHHCGKWQKDQESAVESEDGVKVQGAA